MEKSEEKSPISEAVRKLRNALSETQQQFATRLNLAISTVVRYELSRPPRGETLVQLMKIADEHGFRDLAEVFQSALSKEIGYEIPRIGVTSSFEILPGELEDFQALSEILRFNTLAAARERWKEISEPIKQAGRGKEMRFLATAGLLSQIRKKTASGQTAEEISTALGVEKELVSIVQATFSAKNPQ